MPVGSWRRRRRRKAGEPPDYCDVTAWRKFRVCGSARECRGIGKAAREISGSKAGGRRTRDMNSPCMRDRILLVKAQARWKRGDIEALVRKKIKKIPKVAV